MAKKKIGILTSGGDSPGMNAAIRAIVNEAMPLQIEILGFIEGYQGLIEGKYHTLDSKAVQPVIRWGGSIIKSSRCAEFLQREGRDKAFQTYQNLDLSGLIVIGGNGTVTGAMEFSQENEINIIGATHYSTEKFACISMVKYFESLGIPAEFLEGKYYLEDL